MNARIEPEALLAMLYIQYNTENIKKLVHTPSALHINTHNKNQSKF